MKKYSVIFSKQAEKDIDNIFAYIEDISSRYEAQKVTGKIVSKALKLDYFPERSEPFKKDMNGNSCRVTISGRYRIVYVVDKVNTEVFISRIFSVSQDQNTTI